MSCRCITPFSLLNAYTELIGRSSVSIVSLFKHGKGYRCLVVCVLPRIQGMKPTLGLPLLHGMQIVTQALQTTYSYTDKSRFISVTAVIAISFLWALPWPGSSTLHGSVLGFPLCPAHPAGALPCCATSEPSGSSSFTFQCNAHF